MARSAADIQADLTTWRAALAAIATGQSYSIGGRSLSRVDAEFAHRYIASLERELAAANGTGGMFARTRITGLGSAR